MKLRGGQAGRDSNPSWALFKQGAVASSLPSLSLGVALRDVGVPPQLL